MSATHVTPPRWSRSLLCTWLPDDAMRDAIVGDLHEEFVRDAERVGAAFARTRYRLRVAGIVGYFVFDTLRWRPWASAPLAAASSPVPVRIASRRTPALLGRGDVGLIVAAFGVLGVGIVANTLLFSMRHAPSAAPIAGVGNSVLGGAAVVLALGTAAMAAVMLCVGPRWLRRRACRKAAEARDVAGRA